MTTVQLRLDCALRDAMLAFERRYFEFHLASCNGSVTQLAVSSGMERTNLYRKLRSLGFDLGTRGTERVVLQRQDPAIEGLPSVGVPYESPYLQDALRLD